MCGAIDHFVTVAVMTPYSEGINISKVLIVEEILGIDEVVVENEVWKAMRNKPGMTRITAKNLPDQISIVPSE